MRRYLSTAPLQVSVLHGVAEAVCLFGCLLTFAALLNIAGLGSESGPALAIAALAWAGLAAWPSWRVSRATAPGWWRRTAVGVMRGMTIWILLTALAILVSEVLNHLTGAWPFTHTAMPLWPRFVLTVAFGLGCALAVFRGTVVAGAYTFSRTRLRLRRQLMASHVAAIVLTFGALTLLGSIVAANVVVRATQPNALEIARSVQQDLVLTGQPLNPAIAQRVFLGIADGTLSTHGKPLLSLLVPGSGIPDGMAAFDRNGRFVAGTRWHSTFQARTWRDVPELSPQSWSALHAAALRGVRHAIRVHLPGAGNGEATTLVESPIRSRDRRVSGLVVMRVTGIHFTSTQFVQAVILLFGASSLALIVAAALPLLLLSFLFSYAMARNLTRRLEDVSRVAAAVASGDFAQRAPLRSPDEVGQLANDINLMAQQQEQLISDLRRARTDAEEALATRRRLVADVSHELRTPLAILRAHLESLSGRAVAAGGVPGAAEVSVPVQALEALEGETQRLHALIDDLFALARADTESLDIRREPTDVARLIDEIAGQMRPLAHGESAIALRTEIPPGLPLVMADADRLRQILSNLVRNAIRHTPTGGIVVLSARDAGDAVKLLVADTGEGISATHLPHVFDRFYRVDVSRSRETGGSGLGLAIVRELVELMGGAVSVESEPDVGTTFTVSLPVE